MQREANDDDDDGGGGGGEVERDKVKEKLFFAQI